MNRDRPDRDDPEEGSEPTDEGVKDPIADSLLSEDTYRRRRVERTSGVSWSTERRMHAQSVVLVVLSLSYPLSLLTTAVGQSPVIILVGLFGGVVEFLAAGVLTLVGLKRLRTGGALSERVAGDLVTLEDLATMLSLVTGGVAVGVTVGLIAAGIVAPGALDAVLRSDPFAPSGTPLTTAVVGGGAFVAALGVAGTARWLEKRLGGAD
jgi:hypothetical protein